MGPASRLCEITRAYCYTWTNREEHPLTDQALHLLLYSILLYYSSRVDKLDTTVARVPLQCLTANSNSKVMRFGSSVLLAFLQFLTWDSSTITELQFTTKTKI